MTTTTIEKTDKRPLEQWTGDIFIDQKEELERLRAETGTPISIQIRQILDKALGLPKRRRK